MNTANIANTAVALLKRETWEHRTFWLVPLIIAGLMLCAYLWAMGYAIPDHVGYDLWVDRMKRADSEALEKFGEFFITGLAAPYFVMMAFVIPFYLLDSLYSERRDRSILFWKSLPVTDTATVMSKWGAIFVVFPAFVFATIAVLSFLLTILTGIFTLFGDGNPWELVWSHYSLFDGLGNAMLFFYVEMFWYLPVFGWLMLASAWAKKAPFLWAVLPPVALAIIEEMFLDTNRFLETIGERLAPFEGSTGFDTRIEREFELFDGHVRFDGTAGFDISIIGDLLAAPGFWYGLVFAAACTVGAIWLRRYRDES